MTTLELVLNMLAEATTTELSKTKQPEGFDENRMVAREGGNIAGETRKSIEKSSGRPIISGENALDFTDVIEEFLESADDKNK